ncbi:MAG: VIT1/CCC1 transporter family protein, partial [Ilumatobacteraceae bacterium]
AMYESHGMEVDSAATAAAEVMRIPENALAVHAREELGVDPGSLPSANLAAILSLIAFAFGALMPIVPWYLGSGTGAGVASLAIGIVAAAVVGAIVGRYANRSVPWSAVRQALIVVVACAVTWGIGRLVGVNLT